MRKQLDDLCTCRHSKCALMSCGPARLPRPRDPLLFHAALKEGLHTDDVFKVQLTLSSGGWLSHELLQRFQKRGGGMSAPPSARRCFTGLLFLPAHLRNRVAGWSQRRTKTRSSLITSMALEDRSDVMTSFLRIKCLAKLSVTLYLRSGPTSALFLEKIHFFELKNKTTVKLPIFLIL
ncbi:hypothetical protein AB205_0124520 [Aquarana catesbeiana]|uniref:Uncharacterized protein n=1 Tax=Aquarana catesbeiana TaxID=8400 RepID=A0A2G9PK07_AQUCT|nr:hypothetical protein AB205_0124520 [Aquarana catesbeiana]